MNIKNNIFEIRRRINEAAKRAGRNPDEIRILGVTKKKSCEDIVEALDSGLNEFGENYAQEFRDKYGELDGKGKDIRWHFIGHLQKNKIKYVIGKTELIQSVDSYELAEEINRRSEKLGLTTDILIEVNTGEEKSKTGISFREAEKLAVDIKNFKNINLKGLMTMAPYFDDPELARPYFKSLKIFSNDIIKIDQNADELSMGMSGDFEVAVEEGSTIVRIGSAIFGERNG